MREFIVEVMYPAGANARQVSGDGFSIEGSGDLMFFNEEGDVVAVFAREKWVSITDVTAPSDARQGKPA